MSDVDVSKVQARKAMWFWSSIIVGLLTLQVFFGAWGLYYATKGSPAAVEEDYYNKAVHWDQRHQDNRGEGK